MTIDEAVLAEYVIFTARYDEFMKHNRVHLRVFAEESERIIKTLYKIKYEKTEIDDIIHWLAFWNMLDQGEIL